MNFESRDIHVNSNHDIPKTLCILPFNHKIDWVIIDIIA